MIITNGRNLSDISIDQIHITSTYAGWLLGGFDEDAQKWILQMGLTEAAKYMPTFPVLYVPSTDPNTPVLSEDGRQIGAYLPAWRIIVTLQDHELDGDYEGRILTVLTYTNEDVTSRSLKDILNEIVKDVDWKKESKQHIGD